MFPDKSHRQREQPIVMRFALTYPFRTRMILGVRFVAAHTGRGAYGCRQQNLRRAAILMIGRIEHLCVFQDHFNDMLIAVPPRTATNFT